MRSAIAQAQPRAQKPDEGFMPFTDIKPQLTQS